MNKTIKRNVLISALTAIALCVSLIAGATFALFTSESKVNVAVTSGKVSVVATVNTDSVQTKKLYDEAYSSGLENMFEATVEFAEDGSSLTVSRMIPGDGIKFDIDVENNSNITVKYRTVIACEVDDGLFEGLNVTIGGVAYDGGTKVSAYSTLVAGAPVASVPVVIELPETAGNEYQDKTFKFSYKVEAVQGNASVSDPADDIYYVYSANDLMALQNKIAVAKVEFLNDIDMSGKAWTGLKGGALGVNLHIPSSGMTIIGNGKTISNLSAPLIGATTYPVTINGLTIKDSTINVPDEDYNGAFVAYFDECSVTISGCALKNVTLDSATSKWNGGFIGYTSGTALTISGCTVDGLTVDAIGSVGGFVGHDAAAQSTYTNCTVKNSNLTATCDDFRVGSMIGTIQKTTAINGATSTSNVLSMLHEDTGAQIANPGHELYGRIVVGTLTIDGAMPVDSAEGINAAITAGAKVDLGSATISSVGMSDIRNDISIKNGTLGFGQRTDSENGSYWNSETKFDFRPHESGKKAEFENVTFKNDLFGQQISDRFNSPFGTQAALEFYPEVANMETEIVFKDCTFINEYVHIQGNADIDSTTVNVTFENCNFTIKGYQSAISFQANVSGVVTFKNCTFNFESTSTQKVVDVMPINGITVNFVGSNTVNGTAAEEGAEVIICSKKMSGEYASTINGLENVTVTGIAVK